jgi:uncharacterized membrane protein
MLKKLSILLKIISFLLIIFIWVFTIITFKNLPNTIPIHFGFSGEADDFGDKNMVWLLCVVSTLVFILLIYFSKNPQSPFLNIPQNLKNNPKSSSVMADIMNLVVTAIFVVITYESILVSLGKMKGLSHLSNYLLLLLFGFIISMIIYSYKLKKILNN